MIGQRRMIYLANARVPSEKAHVYQIFKMCEAFSQLGLDVELWHARRANTPEMDAITDAFDYYGVRTRFSLRKIPSWDSEPLKLISMRLWALTQALSYSRYALRALKRLEGPQVLIYTRDLWITFRLADWKRRGRLPNPTVFEAHTFPEGLRRRWMAKLQLIDLIVALTQPLKERFLEAGIPESKVIVAADGVDLDCYRDLPSREKARAQLGIDISAPLAVYIGHLYPWKGVDTLVESACFLRPVQIWLVGGTPTDRARIVVKVQALEADNVLLVGYVPPAQVPVYLAAADVFVLPNSARTTLSREHTSPLKLFEYMAARRPIVATDLPSIREILTHEHNAILVPPDDPQALAEGIRCVLADQELAERLADQAYRDVQQYTWTKRAAHILEQIPNFTLQTTESSTDP